MKKTLLLLIAIVLAGIAGYVVFTSLMSFMFGTVSEPSDYSSSSSMMYSSYEDEGMLNVRASGTTILQ